MQYRKCLGEKQNVSAATYTNDLHEALLNKDGSTFWKCWRSKFDFGSKCREVEGCVIAVLLLMNLLTTLEIRLKILIACSSH